MIAWLLGRLAIVGGKRFWRGKLGMVAELAASVPGARLSVVSRPRYAIDVVQNGKSYDFLVPRW